MSANSSLVVKVSGDFALFTRPEFSAERVSYPIPTPSSARGMLEAILWKPEIRWRVEEIHVLKPIRQFSILRNELNTQQSDRAARSWETGGGYYAEEDRAQRHSLCLRDVEYLIKAQVDLKPHADAQPAKYRDQFRRRVERGQCYYQPYLGTREFSAWFSPANGDEKAIAHSENLGWMLFDVDIAEMTPGRGTKGGMSYYQHDANGARVAQGTAIPKFFAAELQQGILHVPQALYQPV
jgi:CRISPR-associated protein Cas5d